MAREVKKPFKPEPFGTTRTGFTGGRKLAFQSVKDYIHSNKLSMDVLLARIQIDHGMSSAKAQEIVNTLITAGEIRVENEVVMLNVKASD